MVVITARDVSGRDISKRDRQYTYNIILRHVCESLLRWKSNKYYIFVCVRACVHSTCMCGCPAAWACLCACVPVF
jgi:hypothetical protein